VTENVSGPQLSRLDELAAVTREYGQYASARPGLASVAMGAWWLAVLAITLQSRTWGRIAALWSPMVVIGCVAAGRRYYQRFGRVLATESWEPRPGANVRRRKSVWLAALLIGGVVVNTAMYLDEWSGGSQLAAVALIGVLATAPAVPLLVDRVVMGFWDDGLVFFSIGAAQMVAGMTHGGEVGWGIAKLIRDVL